MLNLIGQNITRSIIRTIKTRQREVRVGNTLKLVRDAKFYDDSGRINLAVRDTMIHELQPKTPFKCINVATNFLEW